MLKFAKEGPSAEEASTVTRQIKTKIEEMTKQPSYWGGLLSDLCLALLNTNEAIYVD